MNVIISEYFIDHGNFNHIVSLLLINNEGTIHTKIYRDKKEKKYKLI